MSQCVSTLSALITHLLSDDFYNQDVQLELLVGPERLLRRDNGSVD